MSVAILEGRDEDHDMAHAVFFCTTTMRALPQMYDSREQALRFLTWIDTDPRSLPPALLEALYDDFMYLPEHEAIRKGTA